MFKQIIGRGTRIDEEYNKMYFTILDFRNATDLFADPDFDGEPIKIKETQQEDDLVDIFPEDEDAIVDVFPDGPDVVEEPLPPTIRTPEGDPEPPRQPRPKVYVNGVDVSVLVSRELYFDQHGKPITTSLKDHTKEIIKGQFATLYNAVNKELDLFDLICHVAYDQPPLTRKERAENVKKRDYFTKYGEQARKVLENLLEKYADEGIDDIESIEILKVKPFTDIGSPIEIISTFGSKSAYMEAVHDLENELYKSAI